MHSITHIGHLKIAAETGASRILVLIAAILSLSAMALALVYVSKHSDQVITVLAGFVLLSVLTEFVMQKVSQRKVKPRVQ